MGAPPCMFSWCFPRCQDCIESRTVFPHFPMVSWGHLVDNNHEWLDAQVPRHAMVPAEFLVGQLPSTRDLEAIKGEANGGNMKQSDHVLQIYDS